jgi:hypothetical protein
LACESTWPTGNSPHTALIHILDDDSLLNVFSLYRSFLLGKDNDDDDRFKEGKRQWVEECWWYKLVHVCQRWRNLIFRSASYLGLSLVCTNGTPVADMLAYSPSLPLVIDYFEGYDGVTAEDEEGAILALKQRNRVRRVRLFTITNLQKFIAAIDKEYPILEHLIIWNRIKENTTISMFPETVEAPHLRHFALVDITLPIESRLLTTAVHLVTLYLVMNNPHTYFNPNTLLAWLSFMPKLETLKISFLFSAPDRDVERQPTHPPVMSPVTLPNLYHFYFRGDSTYLEALVHRITPCPEKLDICFVIQPTFSVPCLLQLMNTRENLKFERAIFRFSEWQAFMAFYPRGEAEMYALSIAVNGCGFVLQLSSVAKICNSLSQIFSAVEHLTLDIGTLDSWSTEEYSLGVNSVGWRQLLSSFSNVKTLRIHKILVEGVSRCLELDDGDLSLGLLPELQELIL